MTLSPCAQPRASTRRRGALGARRCATADSRSRARFSRAGTTRAAGREWCALPPHALSSDERRPWTMSDQLSTVECGVHVSSYVFNSTHTPQYTHAVTVASRRASSVPRACRGGTVVAVAATTEATDRRLCVCAAERRPVARPDRTVCLPQPWMLSSFSLQTAQPHASCAAWYWTGRTRPSPYPPSWGTCRRALCCILPGL